MKIPCAKLVPFIVTGLAFLRPELSSIQFSNIAMIASALVLGAKFNLTEISRMWLKEKAVSTLSEFLSDAKLNTAATQHLYILHALHLYKIKGGYFIIDDTMEHHSKFCQWIHGVFILFDHAIGTNLKATCIVFLYYSDGNTIKFPICFRIFYKEVDKAKWYRRYRREFKTKHDLALEMIEWAIAEKFPACTVLADAWFGVDSFIRGLKKLKLSYILEIKSSLCARIPCVQPKRTPTGRLSKKQCDVVNIVEYFKGIESHSECGFDVDIETGKAAGVFYITKVDTIQLNSTPEKHRIVESRSLQTNTTKYYLTNRLHWEPTRILSDYCNRWVIEEFFRNAKQLLDMEGASIRSEQGVTIALCLVTWIDFLLHNQNYLQCTVEELPKESLTIPSIVRQAQYENLEAVMQRMSEDKSFIVRWLEVERENIHRKRKKRYTLVEFEKEKSEIQKAA